ncbi:MAG: DUF2961 domain-containing protein [Tannerellaceae bacterium]|nr:DUF2961 domain-containing protein [Tannerellaceae bacterium]
MAATVAGTFSSCWKSKEKEVSLIGLLDEMTSVEEGARFPAISYRALSVAGRAEKVLFDKRGPGVITRILLASEDKQGVVRFYFNGSSEAEITLPAYDLSLLNIPEAEGGLLHLQANEPPGTGGGSALYLPIPYENGCRITLEEDVSAEAPPKFYQINYRQYPGSTSVETFSLKRILQLKKKIADTNRSLQSPQSPKAGETIRGEVTLDGGSPVIVKLPAGENAVYELQLQVSPLDEAYMQAMRNMVIQGIFDGKQTMRIPASDFSGAGMGASPVESRYLSADGKGSLVSRWLMPYREKASLAFINEGRKRISIHYAISVSPLAWDERMLYFHASWKEETGLRISNTNGTDWTFAAIGGGRGVYKGDVLSLYNHTSGWYGKGTDKISVDDEPAQAGTDAGHYYNNSQRPVQAFHTPFGGAPRVDRKNSHGYNTFFRIRHLDGIPFTGRLKFDMEWLGEKAGILDCATVIFWYGDRKARPEKTSRPEVTARVLLPPPTSESGETED